VVVARNLVYGIPQTLPFKKELIMLKKTTIKVVFFLNMLLLSAINTHASVTITSDKLQSWINGDSLFNFILIDVRDLTSNDSVIATESCRPYNLSWNAGIFKTSLSKIPHNTPVILYCQSGSRSTSAASMMTDSGFTNIYSLIGGIGNWNKPAKPITFVKPSLELPAFSQQSASISQKLYKIARITTMRFRMEKRTIIVEQQLTEPHSLLICNLQGTTLFSTINPFRKTVAFSLPETFKNGSFLIKLRLGNESQCSVAKLIY
jgi:rhodanese-related sulfurtransferase